MHWGFSYVGFLMLAMLFIPNFFWMKNKPAHYDEFVGNESRLLLCFERVGEIAVCVLSLVFSDFNIGSPRIWCLWLVLAVILLLLYEFFWMRYFRSGKTMKDFYSSLFGIPVAGATLPVMAFFALAIYGKNIFLGAAVVILGIGHIGIHLNHRKETQ